jgi:ribosomal protein S11
MFLTLLSKKGYVVNTRSVGMLGFLGPKRPTSFAAEQLGRSFGNYLAEKKVKTFFVVFRTRMSKNIKAAVFGLFSISTDNIVGFVDLVIRAHNGVLPKVRRRI